MPEADEGQFAVTYKAQPGISLERSEEIALAVIAEVRSDEGVDYTYTTVGDTSGGAVNEGRVYVKLKEPSERRYYLDIMADLRQRLERYPAIRTAVGSADSMGPGFAARAIEHSRRRYGAVVQNRRAGSRDREGNTGGDRRGHQRGRGPARSSGSA